MGGHSKLSAKLDKCYIFKNLSSGQQKTHQQPCMGQKFLRNVTNSELSPYLVPTPALYRHSESPMGLLLCRPESLLSVAERWVPVSALSAHSHLLKLQNPPCSRLLSSNFHHNKTVLTRDPLG